MVSICVVLVYEVRYHCPTVAIKNLHISPLTDFPSYQRVGSLYTPLVIEQSGFLLTWFQLCLLYV